MAPHLVPSSFPFASNLLGFVLSSRSFSLLH
uniref:Uncharacterized protein n=1 Tax=Anguilla anguilla TaxID=7936 RepID=A0A0E9PST2_ANGAN